jgi:hypothetical protein
MYKSIRKGNYKGRLPGPPELTKNKLFLSKLTENGPEIVFEYAKRTKDFKGGAFSDYRRNRILEIVKQGE